VASIRESNRYLKVSEIGPGVKISNLLLKNCVPEIDNNSINNHRSIMILTLLNSDRQDLSNGTIIIPKFTFPRFPGGYLFAFEVPLVILKVAI